LKLTVTGIEALGYEWPRYQVLQEQAVMEDQAIDLLETMAALEGSRDFYKRQLNEAYAFKQQTGADYADFTGRHEENSRRYYELGRAIAYLREIILAAST
jgi:hypothetical protein